MDTKNAAENVATLRALLRFNTMDAHEHIRAIVKYKGIRQKLMRRSWNFQEQEENRFETAMHVAEMIARMEKAAKAL
jgi:hypothetical protein